MQFKVHDNTDSNALGLQGSGAARSQEPCPGLAGADSGGAEDGDSVSAGISTLAPPELLLILNVSLPAA